MKTNELKCTDLRIGNWVNINNAPHQIYRIDYKEVNLIKMGYLAICEIEKLQPIELTEELLVKMGFKKERQLISTLFYLDYEIDVDNIIRVKYVIYPKTPSLLKITTSQCGNYECFEFMKRGIKYLHELQNAYYCLTGQELEVNL